MIRRFILPHLHAPETYTALFAERDRAGREVFYSQVWDTPRWRHGCRILFSRRMLAWLGAGREVLRETDGDVSERLTEHVRHLLVDLAPAENPFLQWIQRGEHGSVLPYALRPENFEQIRTYLDRLELHCATLEAWLEREPVGSVDRFSLNHLSDSMDRSGFERVLRWIGHVARGGTRLVHWNLLARTPVPKALSDRIEPMQEVEETLGAQDKSVFHTALSVWRVR